MGGIGTDFEQALEEVRRKVAMVGAVPILLFGEEEYWKTWSHLQKWLRQLPLSFI